MQHTPLPSIIFRHQQKQATNNSTKSSSFTNMASYLWYSGPISMFKPKASEMFPLSCNWLRIFGVDTYGSAYPEHSSPCPLCSTFPSKIWSCGDPTEPTPWCIWSPGENPAVSVKWGSIEIYIDLWQNWASRMEHYGKLLVFGLSLLYVYRQKCICGLNQRPMWVHKSENIASKTHAKKLTHRNAQEYLGSNATSNKQ